MKPVESRVEQELRAELLRSNAALRDGTYGRLTSVLESEGVDAHSSYVVKWIHEQAEDIYAVLVPPCELLVIEIPRGEGKDSVQRKNLSEYKNKCTKLQRLKLAIAGDLLSSHRA